MEQKLLDEVCKKMIAYNSGDAARIQHFLKVHDFARLIGMEEGIEADTLFLLEIASYVHDIGIRLSEEKYGSSAGHYQELEGPAEAREMLTELGVLDLVIERVCYLVGHHHTYSNIDGLDYQILVEADFLVNIHEEAIAMPQILSIKDQIFKTDTGKWLLDQMYCIKKL